MITDAQILAACNKAYLNAGHNAYFSNGFEAGVRFALSENLSNCKHNRKKWIQEIAETYCPECRQIL